ncbi:hypothetical protein Q4557_19645 [Shewanella sp. 5_MG-2023]|uniref:hypothetical protein n=1 Tax=unclassified Shewanella TaxID=196818 RepID=UPI0026E496D8|nr:hypothetical protein [Shewanella sp. 5_MG-2023]MDO6642161.1 hypothetical protein [Shewanella sp. 5_MG-2023]
MDKSSERPFPLLIIVALYFLFGFSALLTLFTDKPTDWVSISFLLVSYGLLTKNVLALIALKVIVAIQALGLGFGLIMHTLFGGDGVAQMGLGSFQFEVSPLLLIFVLILYVGFQLYVAFSKETEAYIKTT